MQELVAPTDGYVFDIETALENQLGAQPLPFPGMDKSGAAICMFYLNGMCSKGTACPFRHVKGDRSVVCKHWLRGLCKKGDDCEFLHEYDMSKMPECYFFSKFGQCSNKECPFLHIDPEKKMKDCPWYDRGFCRHGPMCKNRHVRRLICQCYINGFCLSGPNCKFVHPKFDLPVLDQTQKQTKSNLTCHFCNEFGHKAASCPKVSNTQKDSQQLHMKSPGEQSHNIRTINQYDNWNQLKQRSLDEVTCFKCGEKGHYANKCPKGHLAFLSNSAGQVHTQQIQTQMTQ